MDFVYRCILAKVAKPRLPGGMAGQKGRECRSGSTKENGFGIGVIWPARVGVNGKMMVGWVLESGGELIADELNQMGSVHVQAAGKL